MLAAAHDFTINRQDQPVSGDVMVQTVVENIRLGGICMNFRIIYINMGPTPEFMKPCSCLSYLHFFSMVRSSHQVPPLQMPRCTA